MCGNMTQKNGIIINPIPKIWYKLIFHNKFKIRNGKQNVEIFEREYLNGKQQERGKEYYYNGKIKFEGK